MPTIGASLFSTLTLCSFCAAFASHYDAYRQIHGRDLEEDDAVSYRTREKLYRIRKAEVKHHNARNVSWKIALNRFSDYTDSELQAMLGYKRTSSRWSSGGSAAASSFIQEHEIDLNDNEKLAAEVDWRSNLGKSASWVRNQGACGSCWAVAAVGALEMHAEKQLGSVQRLSHQQLVDCVPNPRHCGGTGGCKGATGEEAFEFTRVNGLSTDGSYHSASGGKCNTKASSVLHVSTFTRLPENKGSYLKHALATEGPVVVSVDGGKWFTYSSGVFSGCEKDTVVNHAVLGVGYGRDRDLQKNYWTIRNSWGGDWGEHGFMRVERHSHDGDYCGIDDKPQEGVYCDGAPATVPVCGMCGILSDSAYPVVRATKSVSRHRNMRAKGIF